MTTESVANGENPFCRYQHRHQRIACSTCLPAGAAMPILVTGSPFPMTDTSSELASGIAIREDEL
jgi:hypothetical protein